MCGEVANIPKENIRMFCVNCADKCGYFVKSNRYVIRTLMILCAERSK